MNRKKRIFAIALFFITVLPIITYADDSNLALRIDALEKRIEDLENLLKGNEIDDVDSFNVGSGIYVVGEDIDAGSYRGVITKGVGYIDLFKSYDDYIDKNGEHFDALLSILMAPQAAIDDLSDYPTQASSYVTETGSLKLSDGMCMAIDNLSLIFYKIK